MKLNPVKVNRRHETCLFYVISTMLLPWIWCYDPCPESYRLNPEIARVAAAAASDIPADAIERAFREAEVKHCNQIQLERRLVREGRVVNTRVRSPESMHPQAFVQPEVREKELRQRRFQEASNILTKTLNLTLDEVCCSLPLVNLTSSPTAARALDSCIKEEPVIQCDSESRYRTADGTCNNLENPTWGSALSCFNRLLPAAYSDGDSFRRSVTGKPLPSARILSLNIHDHRNRPTNYVNNLYMIFGQLLDHDLTFTAALPTVGNKSIQCCNGKYDDHPECAPILIPPDDPFYSRYGVSCLNFVRNAKCPYCKIGPRTQINALTAFVDGSFIYGNSEKEMNMLRNSTHPGNLKAQKTRVGELLPPSFKPHKDGCSKPPEKKCFQAGDFRVNQHPSLTCLHTLFLRQHNSIANQLRKENSGWNENKIFQETRKILGAMMQVVVYGEYLPATFGQEQMSFHKLEINSGPSPTEYNKNLNPGLVTEFSTAAFRFGHTFINSLVLEISERNEYRGHWLRDIFDNPFGLYNGKLDALMRGATRSPSQEFDRHLVPDVTNYLYRIRGQNRTGLDLPAINIQRGRDHGLPSYPAFVRYCTQEETLIRSFDDLHQLMSPENVHILQRNYGDVRDIDLFPGLISENPMPDAVIGPTTVCINGMQFNRLKYGDRFYFEHDGVFTTEQRQELKKVTLAGIICHNTEITEIQERAMLFPSADNPIRPCRDIPVLDLTKWGEPYYDN